MWMLLPLLSHCLLISNPFTMHTITTHFKHFLHSWMWLLIFTLCSLTPYNLDPAESARTHIITFKRPFIFGTWFARNFYYSGECLSIFIMVNNVRMHRFNLLHFFYAIVFAIVNKPTFNGLYLCIAHHYLTFFNLHIRCHLVNLHVRCHSVNLHIRCHSVAIGYS